MGDNYRSMWSGSILLGVTQIPITVISGFQADERDEMLVDVCECCHGRFTQTLKCPAGRVKLTQKNAGEDNVTPVLKGVLVAEGSEEDDTPDEYTVIDPEVIEEIDEACKLEAIEVGDGDVVDYDEIPIHLTDGLYYVRASHDKKLAKGAKDGLATLIGAMEKGNKAIVTEWTPRSRSTLVVLHAIGDALVMNPLPYRPEVREPDDRTLAHTAVDVPAKQVDMMLTLLEAIEGPFEYGRYENEAVVRRAEAIEQAVAGKPIPKRKQAEAKDASPDLMGALEASVEAVKSGKGGAKKARQKVPA